MSANVDERIVQMQFDNQQFEARAQNTITTLSALTQALQLPSASTKGFDQIQNAANQLNFAKVEQAIDTINYRFSTLGIMATQVLNRISNAAIDMGKKLVDSVTMEPIRSGFSEYETKMDSVKRILNSAKNEDGTAVSLGQVNERLDELNRYADKTIYNFMDMTQNIGKFTNAGVDLDKSVLAIQGIANEAALAGANTQEASRAMYNFAQALSSGYVKLIDWKSIENANMATVGFKEQLIETALELGTIKEKGDKYVTTTTNMQGKVSDAFDAMLGFNDSLAHQWMTADVLTTTLAKYANETTEVGKAAFQAATEVTTFSKLIDTLKEALGSGWTDTWQLIIGDFSEAKQLWTSINDVLSDTINNTAEARNTTLEYWREWGGRQALIEGLGNAWHALMTVLKPVKRAFDDILNPFKNVTGAAVIITRLSKSFRSLTEGLILQYPIQRKIWVVAKGLFSVFDLLGQVVSAVWRTIQPIFSVLGEIFVAIAKKVVQSSSKFTEFVAKLKETDAIYNTLQRFVGVLQKVATFAFNAAKSLLGFFGINIEIKEDAGFIESITSVFEAFVQNPFIAGGIDLLTKVRDTIVNFFTGLQESKGFQKVVDGLMWLGDALAKIGGAIKDSVVQMFTQLGGAIKEFFTAADGESFDFDKLFDIGALGAVGLIFKKLYDLIKGKDNPIAVIKQFFSDLKGFQDLVTNASEAFSDFAEAITEPLRAMTTNIKAEALLKIAEAVGVLTLAIWVLSRIEPGKMGVALLGIAAIMSELTGSMTALSKLVDDNSTTKMVTIVPTLIAFSVAIGILSLAAAGLSQIDPDKLVNGVVAVGSLMALMTIMTKLGAANISTKGMVGMSVAILILQIAVKRLAEIDPNKLVNGVTAVGILMMLMTAMSKLGGKNFSGVGMIAVAAAILLLQKAVATFGDMDLTSLAKGVGAVSALLIFMGLFSRISGKGALTASVGTIALAVAMGMLQKVIADFGAMDTDALGNGLLATAASLAAMALALNLMTGTLSGAAALVVAVLALKMLFPVIQGLSELNFVDVLKGIAGLAIAFAVIIAAGYGLGAVVPAFLGFAGAIALMGGGFALLGVGLLAAGVGLAAISVSAVAAATAIVGALAIIETAIAMRIPFMAMLIGKGIMMVFKTIGDSASTLVQVITQIGTALLAGLRTLLVPLGTFVVEALMFLITLLTENVPPLVNALVEMVITVIDGIAIAIYNNTDRLMAAIHHVVGAIIDFILATLQELLGQIPGVGGKITKAIQEVRDGIGETMSLEEGQKQGQAYVGGFAEGAESSAGEAYSAGETVGESAQSGILSRTVHIPELVKGHFKDGIPEAILSSRGEVSDASSFLGEEAVNSATEGFGDTEALGAYLPEGMRDGILDNSYLTDDAAKQMMQGFFDNAEAEAEIQSPSHKTWEMGMYLDEGLANGVTDNQGLIGTAITGLGSIFTNGFQSLTSTFTNAGNRGGIAYAQGLSRGVAPARSAGSSVVGSAVSAIASILPRFGQNGTESGNAYVAGVTNTTGDARVAGSLIGSSAVVGLGTARPAFTITGAASGTNYASGVSSKTAAAKSAGTKIGTSAANGARNYSGFYSAGGDSSQGYLDGLLSKAKKIATAAADMVKNALNAAKDAIDSHSPSRAYEQLGDDSDQGYINGVNKKAGKVKSALSRLATEAMGAFYEGLSRANDAANDELVVTPTVSPVMDMNNVYGGVDFLRNMFNGASSVLGNITADVSNNVEDIHALVNNTNKILSSLQGRKPITLDGKTIIGWVDTELGAL